MTFGRKSRKKSPNVTALVGSALLLLGVGYLVTLLAPELMRYLKLRNM